MIVSVAQRIRHLSGKLQRVPNRQLLLAHQPIPQRLPFDIRHHVVEEASSLTGVVQRQDVRVSQPSGDLDLAEEPVRPKSGRELGLQDLEGHSAMVLEVSGEVHRRHSPTAELALDRVVPGKGGLHAG